LRFQFNKGLSFEEEKFNPTIELNPNLFLRIPLLNKDALFD